MAEILANANANAIDDDEFDPDNPPPVGTVEHAKWLVHWHFEWENPNQIDKLADLYHDDIVWEGPGRLVLSRGKQEVLDNYRKLFESAEDMWQTRIEQYATPTRVFDDRMGGFKLISSHGFPNHPFPVGTRVLMRIVHNFHIQDGLIIRENGYEMWLPELAK